MGILSYKNPTLWVVLELGCLPWRKREISSSHESRWRWNLGSDAMIHLQILREDQRIICMMKNDAWHDNECMPLLSCMNRPTALQIVLGSHEDDPAVQKTLWSSSAKCAVECIAMESTSGSDFSPCAFPFSDFCHSLVGKAFLSGSGGNCMQETHIEGRLICKSVHPKWFSRSAKRNSICVKVHQIMFEKRVLQKPHRKCFLFVLYWNFPHSCWILQAFVDLLPHSTKIPSPFPNYVEALLFATVECLLLS